MNGDNALLTAFVNERLVQVAPGARIRDAVHRCDPSLGASLDAGRAYLTDGRGIPLAAEAPVVAGAIVRVVVSARRPAEPDAHA